jgi:hypothetical protein
MHGSVSVPAKHPVAFPLKIWIVTMLVVFVFGEALLRNLFHLSYFASAVVWIGVLAVLLLCGGVMALLTDG